MDNKKEHYVNPEEFKEALRTYYSSNNMTDTLGEYLKKIAYGLSHSSNFINYTYKDDMVGDALIKMYSALKNKKYKFDTNTNPFSYFTTIAFHAFINRIKKEKRHHEAVSNYRERVYESLMSDPEYSIGNIYVKPIHDDSEDGYDQYSE
jgi:DNA-directed RNA polymerase specialized sigma24 family protein